MRNIRKLFVFLILILVIPVISFYLIKSNQDTRSKASSESFLPTYLSSPKVINLQKSFSISFEISEGRKYIKKVRQGIITDIDSDTVSLISGEEILIEKPANEPNNSRVIMEINLPEDYYSFSLEFYDDTSPNAGFQAGVYNNNNLFGYVIGFRDTVTQGNYMFQTLVPGGKQLNSGIPRQEGWHKLNFLATPEGTVGFFDGAGLRYLPQTEYNTDPDSKFQSGINTKIGRAKKLLLACAWSNLACNVKIRNVQINALNPPSTNLVDRSQILIKQYYSYLTSQLKFLSGDSTLSLSALTNLYNQDSNTIRLISELIPVQAYLYKIETDQKIKENYLKDSLVFLQWIATHSLPNNKTPLSNSTKEYDRIATGIGAWIIDEADKLPNNLKQIIKNELINESRNIYPQAVGNEFLRRSLSSQNATRGTLLAITSNWFLDQLGNEAMNWNKKSRCLIYHSLSVSDDSADSYGEIPGCGVKTKNLFDGDYRDGATLSDYPNIFKNSTVPETVPQKYWMSTHSALPAIHYMYGGSIVEISKAGMIALRLSKNRTVNDIPSEYKHNVFETYNSVRNKIQLETDSYIGTNIGLIKADSVLVDPRDTEWSNENTFLKYGHDDRGTGVYLDTPAYIYPYLTNSSLDINEYNIITKKMWYLAPDFIAFPVNKGLPIYSPNQPWMSSAISRAMINAVALDRLTIATMLVDSNFSIIPQPTEIPIFTPTPTRLPTPTPTKINTPTPTRIPTLTPTKIPTLTPTKIPTAIPTTNPCSATIKRPLNCPCEIRIQCASLTCVSGKCIPVPTIIPTRIPTLAPTKIPTLTPTPTKIPTLPPSLCNPCPNLPQAKSKGDADCSGTTTLNDISIWRSEFISGDLGTVNKNNWQADFNCDSKTDIVDASIWRENFINSF